MAVVPSLFQVHADVSWERWRPSGESDWDAVSLWGGGRLGWAGLEEGGVRRQKPLSEPWLCSSAWFSGSCNL